MEIYSLKFSETKNRFNKKQQFNSGDRTGEYSCAMNYYDIGS